MAKFSKVGLALLVWAFFLYLCIPHAAHNIEAGIAAEAAAIWPAEYVSVDGRDVTLTGPASEQTVKRVAALPGVRSVHTKEAR